MTGIRASEAVAFCHWLPLSETRQQSLLSLPATLVYRAPVTVAGTSFSTVPKSRPELCPSQAQPPRVRLDRLGSQTVHGSKCSPAFPGSKADAGWLSSRLAETGTSYLQCAPLPCLLRHHWCTRTCR